MIVVVGKNDCRLSEEYARTHISSKPGPHVMLVVTDTGVGMDVETQQRIFEPFFTTKELGRGTGLGLSTVYGIVKQNNGNIWVYSEPGRGSTFKVYLPQMDPAPASGEHAAFVAPVPAGGSVMIVEDEPLVCELMVEILRDAGLTVFATGDVEAAIRTFSDHAASIQLVVTDMVLPNMSGPALIEQLRKQTPSLRVLYTSGYTANIIPQNTPLSEADAFLEKPFVPKMLVEKVHELLNKGQQV